MRTCPRRRCSREPSFSGRRNCADGVWSKLKPHTHSLLYDLAPPFPATQCVGGVPWDGEDGEGGVSEEDAGCLPPPHLLHDGQGLQQVAHILTCMCVCVCLVYLTHWIQVSVKSMSAWDGYGTVCVCVMVCMCVCALCVCYGVYVCVCMYVCVLWHVCMCMRVCVMVCNGMVCV